MPITRIVRFESRHGQEVEIARFDSMSESITFAIAAGNRTAWLVLDTSPSVWLSATSLVDENGAVGALERFYRLARETLAAEGVSQPEIDAQLPLTGDGRVPAGA